MKKLHKKQQGFTLVELSIVIVIIGVLIGGLVLGGKIIENSKVNKLATEISQVRQAYILFGDTYNAVPGDYAGAGSDNVIENDTGAGAITPACTNINNDLSGTPLDQSDNPRLNYSVWPAICPGDSNGFIDAHSLNATPPKFEGIVARNHLVFDGFLPIQYTQRDVALDVVVQSNQKTSGKFPRSYASNPVKWLLNSQGSNPSSNITKQSNTIQISNLSGKTGAALDKKMDDGAVLTGLLGKVHWSVSGLVADGASYKYKNDTSTDLYLNFNLDR